MNDIILEEIEELQREWVNEGICKAQEKYGMNNGDCSFSMDMEFREVFTALAKCTYKQLRENGYLESEEN